jgi:hypothetical protein
MSHRILTDSNDENGREQGIHFGHKYNNHDDKIPEANNLREKIIIIGVKETLER